MSDTYTAYVWKDDPSGATPIESASLNRIEKGLEQASTDARTASNLATRINNQVNITSFLINTSAKTLRSGIWEAYIGLQANTNPSGQVVLSGSNGYFRVANAGTYLICVTISLSSAPSGGCQLTVYQATNDAGANRTEPARFHGVNNGLVSGSVVMSLTAANYLSFGVRDANGANTLNAGAMKISVTRLR